MYITTRKDARKLAISYHAYLSAVDKFENDENDRIAAKAVIVWAITLIRAQRDTGIVLVDPKTIKDGVQIAKGVVG